MRIGSEAHKQLFCQHFLDTHRVFEPEELPWPQLDSNTLAMLRSIPFWDEALYTERRAGVMITQFAETVKDPLLREAIALQAKEEARHGRLIEYFIRRYGIDVPVREEAPIPASLESGFVKFGYGECFDSFFAFGLFGIARQAGVVPEALFNIFDALVEEEARHILFFANWIAYKQVNEGWGPLRRLHALWEYGGAVRRRFGSLKGGSGNTSKRGFTATGASSVMSGLTPERFLQTCIRENDRRMSLYDQRLLQPKVMPALAGVGLRVVRLLPKGRSRSVSQPT